jgi:hypothetical protein
LHYVSPSAQHFSEESLVEEYRRMKAEGKSIRHHKHQYFDVKKDRKVTTRQARKQVKQKKFVALKSLKTKDSLKNAVILSEILRRPDNL